jgi:hypothetical protein
LSLSLTLSSSFHHGKDGGGGGSVDDLVTRILKCDNRAYLGNAHYDWSFVRHMCLIGEADCSKDNYHENTFHHSARRRRRRWRRWPNLKCQRNHLPTASRAMRHLIKRVFQISPVGDKVKHLHSHEPRPVT